MCLQTANWTVALSWHELEFFCTFKASLITAENTTEPFARHGKEISARLFTHLEKQCPSNLSSCKNRTCKVVCYLAGNPFHLLYSIVLGMGKCHFPNSSVLSILSILAKVRQWMCATEAQSTTCTICAIEKGMLRAMHKFASGSSLMLASWCFPSVCLGEGATQWVSLPLIMQTVLNGSPITRWSCL